MGFFLHIMRFCIGGQILLLLVASPASAAKAKRCIPLYQSHHLIHPAISKTLKKAVLDIYTSSNCKPFWYDGNSLTTKGFTIAKFLGNLDKQGLSTRAHLYNRFLYLHKKSHTTLTKDALISLGLVKVVSTLRGHPVSVSSTPKIIAEFLRATNLRKKLADLTPGHRFYHRLRRSLPRYIRLTTHPWPMIKYNEHSSLRSIEQIRERLKLLGDWPAQKNRTPFEKAIKTFQTRHGLKADGIIGKATLEQLNTKPSKKLQTIKANLRRWQQLPAEPGGNDIVVNLASNYLRSYIGRKLHTEMKVATGSSLNKTPLMASHLTQVHINPYWHIPPKIAVNEVVPKALENPKFLEEARIKLHSSWEFDSPTLPPSQKSLQTLLKNPKTMRLTQAPGKTNPLGTYKFVVEAGNGIYLHGTHNTKVFANKRRSVSHGCIRLEDPTRLAKLLLSQNKPISTERILSQVASGKTLVYQLKRPFPIYTTYQTAWGDSSGKVHFRPDIYKLDSAPPQS